ncbi:hypothetical protein SPONN_826 [uncultured Candidatus Thioglobus sp.]|nr:hypothetical protein SPONN_826 [uncultured Candidatus Thioglobus sp.]
MYRAISLFLILFTAPAFAISIEDEKNEVLMLLAYSVVYEDWQSKEEGNDRGYNIGAILFDNVSKKIVGAQRNTTKVCDDKTQHAELRLMQQCLNNECRGDGKTRYLNSTSIYTTLEPCMMCSGMMVFLKVKEAIYGQTDLDYGKNIERLKQPYNGKEANDRAKGLSSTPSLLEERKRLDSLFKKYTEKTKSDNIIDFLTTDEAKLVYFNAKKKLLSMKIINPENVSIRQQALAFLKSIDDEINVCFIEHINRS